ncbi:hypothetical protein BKA66DRAFT_515866 [Pyrenochaeta sp. MPI-SDFR-AT-0127]|nr:hypothetical protein BKA66DRAFT_515866 [Pyrenochaeta sp. MPI-SDFR-AT-0127]
MGRFANLNPDTKDLVNCLLPALASSFNVDNVVQIIPEDIRMRTWDCERRDHIKDQTENDPRNWGVQFLKDLMAISRMNGGDLLKFQDDLRAKVVLHEPKHPWCRLADIKELKDEYENPGRKDASDPHNQGSSDDSYDSYFEELVELEEPKGTTRHRKRRNHEVYEARVQESAKRRKCKFNGSHGRLRRSEGGGFQRKDKSNKKRYSVGRATSDSDRSSIQGALRTDQPDCDDSATCAGSLSLLPPPSSASSGFLSARSFTSDAIGTCTEPLAIQTLQAELEVAEAELRAARLKYKYIQARAAAEKETESDATGADNAPHKLN